MCHLPGYKDSAVIQVEEKGMQVSVTIAISTLLPWTADIAHSLMKLKFSTTFPRNFILVINDSSIGCPLNLSFWTQAPQPFCVTLKMLTTINTKIWYLGPILTKN